MWWNRLKAWLGWAGEQPQGPYGISPDNNKLRVSLRSGETADERHSRFISETLQDGFVPPVEEGPTD